MMDHAFVLAFLPSAPRHAHRSFVSARHHCAGGGDRPELFARPHHHRPVDPRRLRGRSLHIRRQFRRRLVRSHRVHDGRRLRDGLAGLLQHGQVVLHAGIASVHARHYGAAADCHGHVRSVCRSVRAFDRRRDHAAIGHRRVDRHLRHAGCGRCGLFQLGFADIGHQHHDRHPGVYRPLGRAGRGRGRDFRRLSLQNLAFRPDAPHLARR